MNCQPFMNKVYGSSYRSATNLIDKIWGRNLESFLPQLCYSADKLPSIATIANRGRWLWRTANLREIGY